MSPRIHFWPQRAARILVLTLASCAPAAGVAVQGCEALAPLPRRLGDTGLVVDSRTGEVTGGVRAFTPQYPLWTDGAEKRRWIRLPAGTSIDGTNPDAWVFPEGTRIWKEFRFDGRPIETRYLQRLTDGAWRFASYVWPADGGDAVLAPERGVRGAFITAAGTVHDVPSRADCLTCHGTGASPVLGFSALQLSNDRDPRALHAEEQRPHDLDLAELLDRGLVRGAPEAWREHPPRIEAANERERTVRGYLHANCGSCHDGGGVLAGLGPRFEYTLGTPAASVAAWLGAPTRHRAPGCGDAPVLIAPGEPDRSVLAHRIAARGNASQMPPLGTSRVDAEAVELVRAWIRADLGPRATASITPSTSSRPPR